MKWPRPSLVCHPEPQARGLLVLVAETVRSLGRKAHPVIFDRADELQSNVRKRYVRGVSHDPKMIVER